MATTNEFKLPFIKPPNDFQITYTYDKQFRACARFDLLPPFLKEHVTKDMIDEAQCTCGCGNSYKIVWKKQVEEIIQLLEQSRKEALN